MDLVRKSFLLLLFAVVTPALSQSTDRSGVYPITFELGSNVIDGKISLQYINTRYWGKLELFLPTPIKIAISQDILGKEELSFKASSPALGTVIQFLSEEDSIRGTLMLSGDRSFPFKGKKDQTLKEPEIYQTSEILVQSENLGFAFPTLSEDGKVLVVSSYRKDFARQTLVQFRKTADGWEESDTLPFAKENADRSPFFAPDGYLYFSSKRPENAGEEYKADYDIWRVKYRKGKWGDPEKVQGINSEANDYQPCITKEGMYFTSKREGGIGGQDIWYAKRNNESFGTPELVGGIVNSEASELSAYVDPDETFMVLATGNPVWDSQGSDDLFLLEMENGEWQFIKNLGIPINSFANEYGAFVFDGQWLYYSSDIDPWAKIYRVKWTK